jgi:hypothetical protein
VEKSNIDKIIQIVKKSKKCVQKYNNDLSNILVRPQNLQNELSGVAPRARRHGACRLVLVVTAENLGKLFWKILLVCGSG